MQKIMIISAVCLVVITLTGTITNASVSHQSKAIEEQENQIYDLQNQLDIKTQTASAGQTQLVLDTTGLSEERKATDDAIAEAFAKRVLTWDNGKDYDAMREEIKSEYDLTEDSDFMQVFLHKYNNPVQPNGETIYYIDTHEINCQFESLESYVTNIQNDKNGLYSYFAFVRFSSSDKGGNEGFATVIMTYDIDADGNLTNIHGYTPSL